MYFDSSKKHNIFYLQNFKTKLSSLFRHWKSRICHTPNRTRSLTALLFIQSKH